MESLMAVLWAESWAAMKVEQLVSQSGLWRAYRLGMLKAVGMVYRLVGQMGPTMAGR